MSQEITLSRRSPLAVLRALVAVLGIALLAVACAASPDVTVMVSPDASATSGEVAAADAPAQLDRVAASPAFLAFAAEQTAAAQSYRFEMYQETSGGFFDFGSRDVPIMTGAVSGDQAQIEMDLGGSFGAMPIPGFSDIGDMRMQFVTDGGVMYLHAPFFASIVQLDPTMASTPGLGWLTTVAQGWGKIDVSDAVGSDVLGQMGMAGATDATQLLTTLESVGEVLDGGTSEVRGEPTRVVYAGIDLGQLIGALGDTAVDIPTDQLGDLAPVNLEVHIDGADRVRRMTFTMDLGAMLADDPAMAGMDMTMWQQLDFFDFDRPVEIVVPVGATDITDDLMFLGGLGG